MVGFIVSKVISKQNMTHPVLGPMLILCADITLVLSGYGMGTD